MTDAVRDGTTASAGTGAAEWRDRLGRSAEYLAIPIFALVVSAALFSLFLLALGQSPAQFFQLLWVGGYGTSFSWQNTLVRSAPLIFTALCVAIPAQLGLVIIGGEGALVLGGLAAAVIALPLAGTAPPAIVLFLMLVAAVGVGAVWIGIVGLLRYGRGVNETIASLLMFYIAISILNFVVEGPLRDPASPNKPSTASIGEANMIGNVPGIDVHWGLPIGILLCVLLFLLMSRTTFGFAARVTGGNVRAAQGQGLPVGKLVVAATAIAGGCAGLAGFFEVAAIHGKANASLIAGYGFSGILVSFLARHNPLAIPPVAILFGGIAAAGGLVQRRMGLPDATMVVLQGLIFVVLLASETLYGRVKIFGGKR